MRPQLIFGLAAALAACSVKPVTFTPESPGGGDAGLGDDAGTGTDDAPAPDAGSTGDTPMFTVSVAVVGSGVGMVMSSPAGIACPGACTLTVPVNTMVTLTVDHPASSTFTGWGGACSGTDTCAFTVTGDTAVTAGLAANNDLIVMRAGNGTGTVTSSPDGISCGTDCSHAYPPGTQVTLTAAAAADSTFVSWEGACSDQTCTVTINQATMVTARFALQPRTLQITHSGTGTGVVSSNPAGISCGTDCTEAYDAHTMVTLSAAPSADSVLAAWSGGGCSGNGACVVTLDNAATVDAQFALRSFILTLGIGGTGTGSVALAPPGVSCTTDCSQAYVAHTVVILTPTAGPNSRFTGWGGACTGTGACQVTIANATSVTATFTQAGHLFTIDESNQAAPRLQQLDPVSQVVTDIGPLGVRYSFGDCAWDSANATLYVVDGRQLNALYRVNLATGAASLVGVHGFADMFALAYHPPSNQLFGASQGTLYRINNVTGAATPVGPTGVGSVDGLAWDSKRNTMIGLAAGSAQLFSVNLATGAFSAISAPSSFIDNLGMAYDSVFDKFWVADFQGRFLQLDPANAFGRTDLPAIGGSHTCLTFVP